MEEETKEQAKEEAKEERELFQENEACARCEHLDWCREQKQPRRVSCAIRMFRKYWEKQLGEEKK